MMAASPTRGPAQAPAEDKKAPAFSLPPDGGGQRTGEGFVTDTKIRALAIGQAACAVLNAAEPDDKVALSFEFAGAWKKGELEQDIKAPALPDHPARPLRPELLPPTKMPKRSARGEAGRIAMLHAVAHIEFCAIDLAWDMVGRFGAGVGEKSFVDDWVRIAAEEGQHFSMMRKRLRDLGADYGDLPAHDGLWDAARNTQDNVLARLAIVPLVLEARGLDVSPRMAVGFRDANDEKSAGLLDIIHRDEVGHVAAGMHWFQAICAKTGREPVETYHALVRARFKGGLKPPFNEAARSQAGLLPQFYQDL